MLHASLEVIEMAASSHFCLFLLHFKDVFGGLAVSSSWQKASVLDGWDYWLLNCCLSLARTRTEALIMLEGGVPGNRGVPEVLREASTWRRLPSRLEDSDHGVCDSDLRQIRHWRSLGAADRGRSDGAIHAAFDSPEARPSSFVTTVFEGHMD